MSAAPSPSPQGTARRQARWPVLLHAGLATALVVTVGGVAMSGSAPTPPAIAEFAPQAAAAQQPENQDNPEEGKDPDASASAQPTLGPDGKPVDSNPTPTGADGKPLGPSPTPTPTTNAPDKQTEPPKPPAKFQCTLTHQTPDPQSAPCNPGWFGTDNGGVTGPGVTKDSIRIGMTAEAIESFYKAYMNFANGRFEMYGRKIVPVALTPKAIDITSDPATQVAFAQKAKEQDVFAVLPPPIANKGSYKPLADVLTANKIMLITEEFDPGRSTADITRTPYQWSYSAPETTTMRDLGDFACASLVNSPAKWALGPLKDKPKRKFGFFYTGDRSQLNGIKDKLNSCGADIAGTDIAVPPGDAFVVMGMVPALAEKLKAEGVTTIIMAADSSAYSAVFFGMPDTYSPEMLTGNLGMTSGELMSASLADTWQKLHPGSPAEANPFRRLFGVMSGNRPKLYTASWAGVALKEGEPGLKGTVVPESGFPTYRSMMLLANGIQQAGPALTAESFAKGLRSAKFDNTKAGRGPEYQAVYEFKAGENWAVRDYMVAWWDPKMPLLTISTTEVTGSNCFVGNGERFRPGKWPSQDKLFNRSAGCR